MFRDSRDSRDDEAASVENDGRTFRIVAIYDSAPASADAARASAVVVQELGDDIAVDRCSWNVRSLRTSSVCDFAASEAARADMIVIALSAPDPSPEIKYWVEQWETKRQLEGGLLALIPSSPSFPSGLTSTGGLEQYFYETAVTANMDFLCRKARRY